MSDSRETLSLINRGLPNIVTFVKVVLKREKLSEEAESYRARYEAILKAMEEGQPLPRPVSLIGDDDSGYHSTKPKGGFLPDQIPSVHHAGFLLKRDDKYRWHRSWCKADGKDMKFLIFNDANEETLVKRLPLRTVTSLFGPPHAPECDKENCFILSGILDGGIEGESGSSDEIYLAAYSEADYQQWRAALSLLTGTRESVRMSSASFLEGSQWAALPDTVSTSSSNFSSSNRESMISTTSSLPYSLRLPGHDSPPRGRSPLEQGMSAGDTSTLSNKQQQPLPSPPPADGQDDDTASVGTIYENIDNLVMQFDSTMQATVQAMGQVGQQLKSNKKHKKKDRSLLRQTSFFKGSKSHKSKLSAQQKSVLERGEKHLGYLSKRSSSGSWKKKWCVLKGAVLSYYKNPEDTEGRDYVVLDAQMARTRDPKKAFAFTVQLRGVPEPLCFGTEEEQVMNDWIARLENASATKGEFDWEQVQEAGSDALPHYHSQTSLDSVGMSETLYNVPRTILAPEQASQATPAPAVQILSADDAINNGIYSIPRSLPVLDTSTFSVQGQSFSLSGDPYAQYDVPRLISLTPDEEAIYDYPENVIDMEIYDYPPDALALLPPPPDMCPNPTDSSRNSVVTLTSEFAPSERASMAIPEDWSHMMLPPPPVSLSASRPSIAVSAASSDEYYQSARNSVASMEGLYDRPRSQTAETLISGIGERTTESAPTETADPPETSAEFGVCAMKGYLYKKERFTWNKMYCLIRNSFLECHKSGNTQGPSLKLFLPRSSVTADKEVKRQWALKVKHPRREGMLQFAAENEEEYKRWMRAFHSAASIEVQSVNTVEEMRITDLDMQHRWTTLERNTATLQIPDTNETKQTKNGAATTGPAVRRNTYSAGDDYMSDTLKRRRKFSWIKNLSKKRGMPQSTMSLGHVDEPHRMDQQMNGGIQKQQSMAVVVAPEDRARHIVTEEGVEQFQGYLKVQRKGADNMWVRYWCILEDLIISCYISKSDLTLTLSIQLKGSRVMEAVAECKRDFSFKIWHLESGQCLFFAADDGTEFANWFKEITKGAEYVVPLDAGISTSPLSAPFYHYTRETADSSPSQRSSRSSIASLPEFDSASFDSIPSGSSSGGTVHHKGNLKKYVQNKWKDRYCLIKDSTLHIYTTSSEKSFLASVSLPGSRVELVNVPHEEVHRFTFRISTPSGKTHMFSASSEQEMYTWAMALQDCTHSTTEAKDDNSSKGNKKQNASKPKEPELLVSYVPANKLSKPVYAGHTEVLLLGAWNRYWCVVQSGCLYLYQNPESQATIRTIVLAGYGVSVGGPQGCKKPCVITLQHPGLATVCVAVVDQIELTKWFHALEHGSKMECMKQYRPVEAQKPKQEAHVAVAKEASRSVVKTKKPMKADHSIETPLQKAKEDKETAKVTEGEVTQHQNAVVRRYEKKIRKTHRVANLTEQNLKQQQTSLLHFKRELSRLTVKLQEMASAGDEHAIKRLKNVRVKLQQIEKIIPYIGKYIMVNRQAEIQTVAILKESCTVDLQRLKNKSGDSSLPPANLQRLSVLSVSSTESQESTSDMLSLPRLTTPLETHLEESESNSILDAQSPTLCVVPAESPSEILQSSLESAVAVDQTQLQPQAASQVSTSSPMSTVESVSTDTPPLASAIPQVAVHDSPLDQVVQKASDPPYANLTAIKAEVAQIQERMGQSSDLGESHNDKEESPYATLASVRPAETTEKKNVEVVYAEVKKSPSVASPPPKSPSNYVELDFSKMQRGTPTSPSSRLNYIQVDFSPNKQKMVMKEEPSKEEATVSQKTSPEIAPEPQDSADGGNSMLEKTLTQENAAEITKTPPVSPIMSTSSPAPRSKVTAMQDAIKLFQPSNSSTPIKGPPGPPSAKPGPPKVKRKPKQLSSSATHSTSQISNSAESTPSPSHTSRRSSDIGSARDSGEQSENTSPLHSATSPGLDDHATEALSVTAGTMSVLDRIKVLQKQNT